jgi:hypothetical protein
MYGVYLVIGIFIQRQHLDKGQISLCRWAQRLLRSSSILGTEYSVLITSFISDLQRCCPPLNLVNGEEISPYEYYICVLEYLFIGQKLESFSQEIPATTKLASTL